MNHRHVSIQRQTDRQTRVKHVDELRLKVKELEGGEGGEEGRVVWVMSVD